MKIKYISYHDFDIRPNPKISVTYVARNGLEIKCEIHDTQAVLTAIDKIVRPSIVKKIKETCKAEGGE